MLHSRSVLLDSRLQNLAANGMTVHDLKIKIHNHPGLKFPNRKFMISRTS